MLGGRAEWEWVEMSFIIVTGFDTEMRKKIREITDNGEENSLRGELDFRA